MGERKMYNTALNIGWINTFSQGAFGSAFKNRGYKFRQPTWHL
jgi:hypothetical protein